MRQRNQPPLPLNLNHELFHLAVLENSRKLQKKTTD